MEFAVFTPPVCLSVCVFTRDSDREEIRNGELRGSRERNSPI